MVFLTCLILSEFVPIIYTAPKLGHVLFDPLSYEAAMFVTKDVQLSPPNDAPLKFLRVKDKADGTTKKPCLGYDYDDKLCKLLEDRIICGYNKNLGQPKDSETVIDIGNGCFIRGNRVECGYVIGPYSNTQRSSQSEINKENMQVKIKTISKTIAEPTTTARQSVSTITTKSPTITTTSYTTPTTTTTVPSTTSTSSKTTTVTTPIDQKLKEITTEITTKNSGPNTAKPKLMCVDKNNSLFCYEIKESNYFIY